MAEHARDNNFQWVDTTLCVLMDSRTGELERFGPTNMTVGTFKDALDFSTHNGGASGGRIGFQERRLIVRLDCVAAFKLRKRA